MSDRPARLTDPAELVAFLGAQAAGLIWNFTVAAAIVRRLADRGDRNMLSTSMALGVATDIAVLVLFLFLRWLLAKTGRGQRRDLTDLREIGAYVLTQVIGFIFSFFVEMPVLGSLNRSGVPNLAAVSFAMNVVSILLALLVFLFLRRVMTTNAGQQSRGAAGFGFGLAFGAWVIAALTMVNATGMPTGCPCPIFFPGCSMFVWRQAWQRGPGDRPLCSHALSAKQAVADRPSDGRRSVHRHSSRSRLDHDHLRHGVCRQMGVGWSLRAGAESAVHAIFAGPARFGVPYFIATFLWSFYYLRPSR